MPPQQNQSPAGFGPPEDVNGFGPPEESAPPPKERFWESLGHSFGIGDEEAKAKQKELKEHPIASIAKMALGPVPDAVQGAYQGAKRIGRELMQIPPAFREGNPALAGVHAVQALPFVGPAIARGAEQLETGESINPAEVGTALGSAIQTAPMLVDPLFGGAKSVGSMAREAINPSPNYVSPLEQAVRAHVKSLNLPVNSVEPTVQQLLGPQSDGAVAGIIKNYAERAGRPINNPLDAAKVAHSAGNEVYEHYRQLTDPYMGEKVSVRSAGSPIGSGEGSYATLGEVEGRIAHINKLEKAARDAAANGNPQPLAGFDHLEAERSGLQSILYRQLAKHTGLSEEQIGDLRQTYGKLRAAGDTFTRASNAVKEQAGLPATSVPQAVGRLLNKLRGGQEAVFNSRFRSTIPDLPSNAPDLPQNHPLSRIPE